MLPVPHFSIPRGRFSIALLFLRIFTYLFFFSPTRCLLREYISLLLCPGLGSAGVQIRTITNLFKVPNLSAHMPRTSAVDIRMDGRDKRRKHSPSSEGSKLNIDYLLNSSRAGGSSHQGTTSSSANRHARSTSSGGSSQSHSLQAAQEAGKKKSKDRPHECEMCGFSFGQRSDRNKHIRTVHFGERPYTCEYCSQSFGEKGNL